MAATATALGLETLRRSKGLSLGQIADETKISPIFLEAIESEEYAKLPGGVFNRSYIRQYAAAVGIPDDFILDAYARYEDARQKRECPEERIRPTRSSGLRWLASLIASLH